MLQGEDNKTVLQIHTDHLGTPRAVSNASNEALWRMEGDQFGDVKPQIEKVKLPLRHAGQYADDESGLFYNYFRYYDPATGRYVTSDPIGLAGGLNTFGYVGGSPVHYNDPLGLRIPALGGGGAGTMGGGISGANLVSAAGATTASALGVAIVDRALDSVDDDCPQNCQPLIDQINTQTEVVKNRYYELHLDRYGLAGSNKGIRNPNDQGHGSWKGHLQRFKKEQQILQALLLEAYFAKCRQYVSQESEKWAKEPAPTQPDPRLANEAGFF